MNDTKATNVAPQLRHSNIILRDDHVGISLSLRGKANKIVAENTTNELDLQTQIQQIGLSKCTTLTHLLTSPCTGSYIPVCFQKKREKEVFWPLRYPFVWTPA